MAGLPLHRTRGYPTPGDHSDDLLPDRLSMELALYEGGPEVKQGLEAIELSPLDPSILPTLEGTRLERAAELIRALTRRGLTLGVAESCTGGLLEIGRASCRERVPGPGGPGEGA